MRDQGWRPKNPSVSEEQLLGVKVGKRTHLNKTIDLEPYNPEWLSMYAKLEGQMRDALGPKL
jgi:GrpB-like predicted nucleotidyltransferase (UPF0157 family)